MSFDTWFNNQYDRRASSSVGYAHDGPLVLGFDQQERDALLSFLESL